RDVQVLGRLTLRTALRKRQAGHAKLFRDQDTPLPLGGQGQTSLIPLSDGSVSLLLKGRHGLTSPIPLGDGSVSLLLKEPPLLDEPDPSR
ncbi:hypothetical protein PR003_g35212, partial [Phytophthora rubi]